MTFKPTAWKVEARSPVESIPAASSGYLRLYMPTNRAVGWLRSPRGLKQAIHVALVATPADLGLTALAIQGAAHPGLGWLNVLVFLLFWNAMKFAWMAVLSLSLMAGRALARLFRREGAVLAGQTRTPLWSSGSCMPGEVGGDLDEHLRVVAPEVVDLELLEVGGAELDLPAF